MIVSQVSGARVSARAPQAIFPSRNLTPEGRKQVSRGLHANDAAWRDKPLAACAGQGGWWRESRVEGLRGTRRDTAFSTVGAHSISAYFFNPTRPFPSIMMGLWNMVRGALRPNFVHVHVLPIPVQHCLTQYIPRLLLPTYSRLFISAW